MTKRSIAIAISAAAKAAAGGNPLFVFASSKENLPDDDKGLNQVLASSKYSVFACKSCDTSMTARTGTAPFCVTCGTTEVVEAQSNVKSGVTAKSDLASLACTVCDHVTAMEAGVVSAIITAGKDDGKIHCSCCGAPMFVTEAAAEDGAENGSQELKPMDVPPPPEKFAEPAAPSKASAEDAGDKDGDGDVDLDDLDEVDASSSGDDMTTPDTPKIEAEDMVIEPFSMDEDEITDDLLEDPVMTEEIFEDELDLPEIDGDPLVDALELDDTDMALAFVRANGRVVAMKGAHAIAAFTRKSAGANYALVNSDALPAAAKAAVGHSGLRAGLQEVGFEMLKVPSKSDAVLSRKVQEIQASADKKESNRRKEFASIFALAAAGLNRGNWKGFENPMHAALTRELGNMGVQAPKRIAASILAEAGLKYAETLLQVSNKLSAMSASSRQELAAMLDMTAITAAAEEEEDGNDVVATNLETRFSTPALLRASVRSNAPAKGLSGADAILSGAAELKFAGV